MSTEFIVVKQSSHGFAEYHQALLANALAQSRALMIGSKASGSQLPGHQDFPGNRPSTTLMLDSLTPASLGALLAKDLTPRFDSGDTTGLDASTAGLLGWLREK